MIDPRGLQSFTARPSAAAEEQGSAFSEDELFEMANLYPRTTGLPMTIWVSVKGGAQHDIRIKANQAHGDQMDPSNCAVFGVPPQPGLLHGAVSTSDERAVCAWVTLNTQALIEYWFGRIDTAQLIGALRPLPP